MERTLERTLPVGHVGIAGEIAAQQIGLDRGNAEAVRSKGERCADAAIAHRQLAVRPFDVFGLPGSLGGKILQAPGTFTLELRRSLANLPQPCQGREFAEIREAMIIASQFRMVKVLQAARKVNFRFSGGHGQTADIGASASQNQKSIRPPRKPGVVLNARGNISDDNMGFVLPSQ